MKSPSSRIRILFYLILCVSITAFTNALPFFSDAGIVYRRNIISEMLAVPLLGTPCALFLLFTEHVVKLRLGQFSGFVNYTLLLHLIEIMILCLCGRLMRLLRKKDSPVAASLISVIPLSLCAKFTASRICNILIPKPYSLPASAFFTVDRLTAGFYSYGFSAVVAAAVMFIIAKPYYTEKESNF